jgi:hypothetical protein
VFDIQAEMKEKLLHLFETRMFLIVLLLPTLLVFLSGKEYFGTVGINRTVNWAWDFRNLIFGFTFITSCIFLIGYGIIALLKYRTSRYWSLLYIGIIAVSAMLNNSAYYEIITILVLLSLVVFIINIFWAVKYRKGGFKSDSRLFPS